MTIEYLRDNKNFNKLTELELKVIASISNCYGDGFCLNSDSADLIATQYLKELFEKAEKSVSNQKEDIRIAFFSIKEKLEY